MKALLIVTALGFSLSAAAGPPQVIHVEPTDIGVKLYYSNGVVNHMEKCTPYYVDDETGNILYQCTSPRYRLMFSPNGDAALIIMLKVPR